MPGALQPRSQNKENSPLTTTVHKTDSKRNSLPLGDRACSNSMPLGDKENCRSPLSSKRTNSSDAYSPKAKVSVRLFFSCTLQKYFSPCFASLIDAVLFGLLHRNCALHACLKYLMWQIEVL